MQELIRIEAVPAHVSFNYDEIKDELDNYLSKFDVVVSEDGVKEAKGHIADVNKAKKALADYRKQTVKELTGPIRAFEAQVKELEGSCDTVSGRLKVQVGEYESQRLQEINEALSAALEKAFAEHGVTPNYQRATVRDLVKLSALTPKGNLTASVGRELKARVMDDLQRQNLCETRILQLAQRCYETGMLSPLTRVHVAHCLEADDETYEAEVSALIEAELQRQQKAKQVEAKREQAQAQPEPEPQPEPPAAPTSQPEPQQSQPVHRSIRVLAHFELDVNSRVTDEQIEAELRRVMTEKAGVKSLTRIEIHNR